jgi:hypothetical protein
MDSRLVNMRTLTIVRLVVMSAIVGRFFYQISNVPLDLCGVYCRMAMNYSTFLEDRSFDSHFLQKSFSSLVGYLAFVVLDLPRNSVNANIVLLAISTSQLLLFLFFWHYLCSLRQVHRSVEILGLFLCLVNPVVAYYHFHFMEIPDASLLLIGTLVMIAVSKKSITSLFLLYLLSVLIAPQVRVYLLLLLMVHPLYFSRFVDIGNGSARRNSSIPNRKFLTQIDSKLRKITAAHLYGFFVCLNVFICLFAQVFPSEFGMVFSYPWLLPISIASSSLIYTVMLNKLLKICYQPVLRLIGVSSQLRPMLVVIFIFEVFRILIVDFLAKGPDLAMTSSSKGQLFTLYSWFFYNLKFPGLLFFTTINFFGFAMLFIIMKFLQHYKRYRFSDETEMWSVVFLLSFPFLINSEARHQLFLLPIIVLLVAKREHLTGKQLVIIGVMHLLTSRLFLTDRQVFEASTDQWGLFFGPWMQATTYVISICVTLSLIVVLNFHFSQKVKILLLNLVSDLKGKTTVKE